MLYQLLDLLSAPIIIHLTRPLLCTFHDRSPVTPVTSHTPPSAFSPRAAFSPQKSAKKRASRLSESPSCLVRSAITWSHFSHISYCARWIDILQPADSSECYRSISTASPWMPGPSGIISEPALIPGILLLRVMRDACHTPWPCPISPARIQT